MPKAGTLILQNGLEVGVWRKVLGGRLVPFYYPRRVLIDMSAWYCDECQEWYPAHGTCRHITPRFQKGRKK